MNPVNVQLNGKITDIQHDRRPGHVTIFYRTYDDVDGRVEIPHHQTRIRRISSSEHVGKPVTVEYSGARPVGVRVGRTDLLEKAEVA